MASKYSVEICGVNGSTVNCNDAPPTPTPSPTAPPQDCNDTAKRQILLGVAQCFQIPIVMPVSE